ncbi:MAG: cardiolipin synthase B [Gemmatimonadales bacterium]|nr:cardiolipin synthase B [Gemmatimonadales bacterium]
MSDALGFDLPWWGWALLLLGAISLVAVIAALFFPDWREREYSGGFDAPAGSDEFMASVAAFVNVPLLRGGEATLLQNGDGFYPAMLEAIRGARDTINFDIYIFEPDEIGRQFMEAFKERARAGVEVRLLVDAFGSLNLKRSHCEELREAGVRVEKFRPFKLLNLVRIYRRTHRRALVIDGRVGFTGGAAISKKWKGNVSNPHEWRDSMTRVTGPLVNGIQSAFANSWVYTTGEVIAGPRFYRPLAPAAGICGVSVVSSPSDAQQPIRLLFWLSFRNAQQRLWICNSYFIPDAHLRTAVIERARDGVDVRVLVPGNYNDAVPVQLAGRSFYDELLRAGVRIFEYQPAMMHAKTVVVDDAWSIVGSANLDERSMEINEENILGISDPAFAASIVEGVEADLGHSKEIKLEEWRKRPLWQRGLESLAKSLIEQF